MITKVDTYDEYIQIINSLKLTNINSDFHYFDKHLKYKYEETKKSNNFYNIEHREIINAIYIKSKKILIAKDIDDIYLIVNKVESFLEEYYISNTIEETVELVNSF